MKASFAVYEITLTKQFSINSMIAGMGIRKL